MTHLKNASPPAVFFLFFMGLFVSANAQDRENGCVGPLPGDLFDMIDTSRGRPIQREVFQGMPSPNQRNVPGEGTVIRVYSQPLELTGDFDDDGVQDTVRALTESLGPGGVDPCPGGANGAGCTQGERVIQTPFMNSTGEWSLPAVLEIAGNTIARSESTLGNFTPSTYEIRFTSDETGSFAIHAFTDGRVVRFPFEIWDIGNVAPGSTNEASDDVRMAVYAFSDGGMVCDYGYEEVELETGVWISDRIYGYYFVEGADYDAFHAGVEQFLSTYPYELFEPLVGSRRNCEDGHVSIFACAGVDLLAYLPKDSIGGAAGLNDIWGWKDPVTGSEYALVGRNDGVSFVDLSDPLNPLYVGQLPTPTETSVWRDIKVYADHAFIVADATNLGMQVFDLTELRSVATPPVSFTETTRYDGISGAHNLAINTDTGFAYAVLDSSCPGLHMIDISNPVEPSFAGCFSDQGNSHDVQCVTYAGPDTEHVGKEICIGSNISQIGIVDVTTKSAPVALATATYPSAGYIHQGWLTEDHRYFVQNDETDDDESDGYRTMIWDLEDLDTPLLATTFEGPVAATDHNLHVKGTKAYLANYQSGMRVLDLTNILAPREVAYFDTYPHNDNEGFGGAWTAYPFLDSGNLLVSSRGEGLFVLTLQVGVANEPVDTPPIRFRLHQNYPNPVGDATTISYTLPAAAEVTLEVWDLLGRRIRVLSAGAQSAGRHDIVLEVHDLPNGTYLYRLNAGSTSETRRLVVAR